MKKIFFDTETSGLDCNSCKIIELAMITVEDGEITDRYDRFVNIHEPLDPKITELTGIDDKTLDKKGVGEDEIARDLKERMTKGTWMIAHNAQFDIAFVYSLLQRHFPDEAVALAMKEERDDLKFYENLFGYNPKWHKKEIEFEFIEYKAQPYHNRGMLPPDKILPNV